MLSLTQGIRSIVLRSNPNRYDYISGDATRRRCRIKRPIRRKGATESSRKRQKRMTPENCSLSHDSDDRSDFRLGGVSSRRLRMAKPECPASLKRAQSYPYHPSRRQNRSGPPGPLHPARQKLGAVPITRSTRTRERKRRRA